MLIVTKVQQTKLKNNTKKMTVVGFIVTPEHNRDESSSDRTPHTAAEHLASSFLARQHLSF